MLPLGVVALTSFAFSSTNLAPPREPEPIALSSVRLSDEANAPPRTVLIRGGRIVDVIGDDREPPADLRVIDGSGMLCLPAFVDAFAHTGCATPTPKAERDAPPNEREDLFVDMREANRKGVQPAFRAADVFELSSDAAKTWREAGFGVLLSAPHGQILGGQSALAVTRDGAPRDRFVRPVVFDHAGFDLGGPGYPNTLMGSIAQLRQFVFDAQRHREIATRVAKGASSARLPWDADLEAFGAVLARERRVFGDFETADGIDRWLALADELGFDAGVTGGREAWKRAKVLAERSIPLVLTLEWREEPDDPAKDKKKDADAKDAEWLYEAPLAARAELRRQWDETRDGAIRLHEAGVRFAFGSGKRTSPKELVERARLLVEKGLPRERALAALTSDAAAILGVEKRLGRVEKGFDATLCVWTKDPLTDKSAKLAWILVDGFAHEFDVEHGAPDGKPDDGVDATGTWTLEFESADVKPATAELEMAKDGAVSGKVTFQDPVDGTERTSEFVGRVRGRQLEIEGSIEVGPTTAKATIEGEITADAMKGSASWKGPSGDQTLKFEAKREPKEDHR